MSPYRRMVLGFAMQQEWLTWRQVRTIARSVSRYEHLQHEERPSFNSPYRRLGWPAFIWAMLRGNVDQPFVYSGGVVLAVTAYFFVAAQLVVWLVSWAWPRLH